MLSRLSLKTILVGGAILAAVVPVTLVQIAIFGILRAPDRWVLAYMLLAFLATLALSVAVAARCRARSRCFARPPTRSPQATRHHGFRREAPGKLPGWPEPSSRWSRR